MSKKITLESYRNRVLRVVDYIWQNLDQNLDVNTLADIAHFSPYHFHRIYRELMHETTAATVRRLRLHRAAVDLLRSSDSVERIAKRFNYGSLEAFSRAFHKYYELSPSDYRISRQLTESPLCYNENTTEDDGALRSILLKDDTMKNYPNDYSVAIDEVDTISLAGLFHKGDYNEVGATFEKIFIQAQSKNLMNDSSRVIGIYYDDPAADDRSALRSHACITASKADAEAADLEPLSVGGGKHAILDFTGPYSDLEQAYEWFYGSWLPKSGFDAADAPPFEEYLNDHKTVAPADLKTRIYLPLAKQ